MPHEALYSAAGYNDAFSIQLLPNLVSTVDLQVNLPDALDMRNQGFIALRSLASQGRIALLCGIPSIA